MRLFLTFVLLLLTVSASWGDIHPPSRYGLDQHEDAVLRSATFFSPGPPVWSPDGQYIAFVAEYTGQVSIWIMDSVGRNPANLTSGFETVGSTFSWAPDSSRIVFEATEMGSSVSDIWIVDLDGTNLTKLTGSLEEPGIRRNSHPTWSPDGHYIGFESMKEDRTDIYVLDLADSSFVNVTEDTGVVSRNLSWSYDGQYVAFQSLERGSEGAGDWLEPQILVKPINGGEVVSVSRSLDGTLRANAKIHSIDSISWSPADYLIVFSVTYAANADIADVFVVNQDGDALVNLTGLSWFTDVYPAWSPDGETIAFVTQYGNGGSDIWITSLSAETIPVNLTHDDEFNNFYPAWSPDGETIAFQADRGGTWNIWTMNVDGSNLVNLTGDF